MAVRLLATASIENRCCKFVAAQVEDHTHRTQHQCIVSVEAAVVAVGAELAEVHAACMGSTHSHSQPAEDLAGNLYSQWVVDSLSFAAAAVAVVVVIVAARMGWFASFPDSAQ